MSRKFLPCTPLYSTDVGSQSFGQHCAEQSSILLAYRADPKVTDTQYTESGIDPRTVDSAHMRTAQTRVEGADDQLVL
jgi:hypothetical protein